MYRDTARLLMYSDLGENSILLRLSQILRDWEQGGFSQEDLVRRIYAEINDFVKSDFAIFRRLFHYDFSPVEKDLGIRCFTSISHYLSLPKREQMYNRDISWQVRILSRALSQARDEEDIFSLMTSYYRQYCSMATPAPESPPASKPWSTSTTAGACE